MRILIYGAGVIGSLYAALFARPGLTPASMREESGWRRSKPGGFSMLKTIRYGKRTSPFYPNWRTATHYDFIFLTVRENQLIQALGELKTNRSPCIVTMVNSIDDYGNWESICGKGRILPAFPGAGGGIQADVLDASLTPRLFSPPLSPKYRAKKRNGQKPFPPCFGRPESRISR